MPDASSPYLNRQLRTEEQVRRELSRAYQKEREEFSCQLAEAIRNGAFTRIYAPDGSYKLVPANVEPVEAEVVVIPIPVSGEVG